MGQGEGHELKWWAGEIARELRAARTRDGHPSIAQVSAVDGYPLVAVLVRDEDGYRDLVLTISDGSPR